MMKSIQSVIYKIVLIQARIYTLKEVNCTISKQCKAKKTRIQQRGIFNIQNANTLLNIREVDVQLEEEMCMSGRGQGEGRTTVRRCGNCGEPGHNICIYKKDKKMSNVYSSD